MIYSTRRLAPALAAGAATLLLQSCATMPGFESAGWKQLAAAADAQSAGPGTPALQFAWETPKQRLLMLARQGEDQVLLYQIDPRAGTQAADTKRVRCHFDAEQLLCAGPGEATAAALAGADPFAALQAHAAGQLQKLGATQQAQLRAQLGKRPEPRLDLAKQRHPFEWGGEHETVENAQAFLEAATAKGMRFRSSWPEAPWLGSQGNSWQNKEDLVTFKTTERCVSLASSPVRIISHYNHDFWAAETVEFKTAYRWQQPIDWRAIEGLEIDKDGVFVHGKWNRPFQGQGLSYVSGWSPDILTANAKVFDPAKYSVAAWNVHLMLPANSPMRERIAYAMTFLDIMCKKG